MAKPLINQVAPGLFVGNLAAAVSPGLLRDNAVDAAINLCGPIRLVDSHLFGEGNPSGTTDPPEHIDTYNYTLPVQELLDDEIDKTIERLKVIAGEIGNLLSSSKIVLVYCEDGQRKSLLTAGFYLINSGKKHESVVQHLNSIYPDNRGFTNTSHRRLLRKYGEMKK